MPKPHDFKGSFVDTNFLLSRYVRLTFRMVLDNLDVCYIHPIHSVQLPECQICARSDLRSAELTTDIQIFAEHSVYKIKPRTFTLFVVAFHLPPDYLFDSRRLENLITFFGAPFILCGDFNAPSSIWSVLRGVLPEDHN